MYKNRTIQELSEQDRPYEKFARYGAESLTDAELLAVILRSGTKGMSSVDVARLILDNSRYENGIDGLFHMGISELEKIPGIGRVKAIQLKCICEISKRMSRSTARRSLNFNAPSSIAGYYAEALRHEEQELVYCMMLDTKNALIGDVCVTKGTVNCSLITPRELFLAAFSYHAVSIILVHNHPSGDPAPSTEDVEITQRIYDAGNLLGISLLDHIIIGRDSYVSIIAEERLIDL
ncbi:MAG TPA: DNA repair protein RadC [Candidatus Alectryocaccobium stercorigallinarum]|nr:DNA repair protein RadC [Candidatus Alectryocaccobium stercorigallinarum]